LPLTNSNRGFTTSDLAQKVLFMGERMKTFLWLQVLALAMLCYASWILGDLTLEYISDFRPGSMQPALAHALVHHTWLLIYPLPWVVCAAWLSRGSKLTVEAVLIFTGTVILALVVLISIVAIGAWTGCVPSKL
jgi:hypothetical protein